MTWAEFRIRLHAYKRQDLKEWYKIRAVMYQIYVSNWMDSKRKPKSINQFMELDPNKKAKITNKMAERIKQAQEEYFKQRKELENNG